MYTKFILILLTEFNYLFFNFLGIQILFISLHTQNHIIVFTDITCLLQTKNAPVFAPQLHSCVLFPSHLAWLYLALAWLSHFSSAWHSLALTRLGHSSSTWPLHDLAVAPLLGLGMAWQLLLLCLALAQLCNFSSTWTLHCSATSPLLFMAPLLGLGKA